MHADERLDRAEPHAEIAFRATGQDGDARLEKVEGFVRADPDAAAAVHAAVLEKLRHSARSRLHRQMVSDSCPTWRKNPVAQLFLVRLPERFESASRIVGKPWMHRHNV